MTTKPYNTPRPDRVRVTERVWAEEVRRLEAAEGIVQPRENAYQFSNGRRFARAPEYQPAPGQEDLEP